MLVDNRLSTFRRGHYQNLGILSTGSSQTEPRNLEETLSIKKFGFKGLMFYLEIGLHFVFEVYF